MTGLQGYDTQYRYIDWKPRFRVEVTDCRNPLHSLYKHRVLIMDDELAYEFMIWAHNMLGFAVTKEIYKNTTQKRRPLKLEEYPRWIIDNSKNNFFYIRNDLMPILSLGWKE